MNRTALQIPDRSRTWPVLNLILAVTQVAATYLAFVSGIGQDITALSDATVTPVTPANYAFGIWSFIYPASIVYAVFALLPAQRSNEVLRRLAPATASVFLANTVWAIVFQLGWFWVSAAVIWWMLASLAVVFMRLVQTQRNLTHAEHWCVRVPLSVFTGWITVATIANTTFALRSSGVRDLGLGETVWAIGLLVVATVIGSLVTAYARGNPWYAGTVAWGLTGILVANITRESNPAVAVAAALAALFVAGSALWAARQSTQVYPAN